MYAFMCYCLNLHVFLLKFSNCNCIIKGSEIIVGSINCTIPTSVTGIGDYAFYKHHQIKSFSIPDNITYIGDDIEDGWKLSYISTAEIVKHIDRLGENHIQQIFEDKWGDLRFRLLSSDIIKEENAILSIRIRLQRFMIKRIIAVFCNQIEAIIQNKLPEDHQELFNMDETLKAIHDIYWKPLVQKCYDGIHLSQLQGERVLTSLLNTYLEAVLDPKLIKVKTIDDSSNKMQKEKDKKREIVLDNMIKSGMLFETISNNYRDELSPIGQFIPQDNYGKFMLVTDYISGMADTFAYNRYKSLCVE